MTDNFTQLSNEEPNTDPDATEKIIRLPKFKDDTRQVITMRHPSGHIVGKVRAGSLVHRVMIANGYKVARP